MPEARETMFVSSFDKLHAVLSNYRRNNAWLFRGHTNPEYKLVPQAGRSEYASYDDHSAFQSWQRQSVAYIETAPVDDVDWLCIAQHHGLATRLLDWTYNPLVAAYFAVRGSDKSDATNDAVIYAHYSTWRLQEDAVGRNMMWKVSGIERYRPRGLVQRITRQSGIITVHNPPTADLEKELNTGRGERLHKIVIDKSYRRELLFELSHYGLNEMTLFPDLDGLSRHVNWFMRNRSYWSASGDIKDIPDAP